MNTQLPGMVDVFHSFVTKLLPAHGLFDDFVLLTQSIKQLHSTVLI